MKRNDDTIKSKVSNRVTAKDANTKGVKAHQRKVDRLKLAFKRVAASEDGALVLRWLMDRCLWKSRLLGFNKAEGNISTANTEYNVARRDVWMDVRMMIPWNLLNPIEQEVEPDDDEPITDTE